MLESMTPAERGRGAEIALAMANEALSSGDDSPSRPPMAKKPAPKSAAKAKPAAKAKADAKKPTKKK
jgi:hypothetical protein